MIPVVYKVYSKTCRSPRQLITTFKHIKEAYENSHEAALYAFLAVGYIPNDDAVKWNERVKLFGNCKEVCHDTI